MDENECLMRRVLCADLPILVPLRVRAVCVRLLLFIVTPNEATRKHLSLKCMRARIFLFLWFHNTAIMDFWFFFGFCETAAMCRCVPFSTHSVRMSFGMQPVFNLLYALFPIPCRHSFFNRLLQSVNTIRTGTSIQWDRKESMQHNNSSR